MAHRISGDKCLRVFYQFDLHGLVLMKFGLLAILTLLAVPLFATYGEGNARLEKLYSTFMSPCCWGQNLTLHDSSIAQQLRARILGMVNEGRSDEEIKAVLVAQYGRRILALPDGPERSWLFATPWLASVAGLFGLIVFVWRTRTMRQKPIPGLEPAGLEPGWDEE